MQKDPYMILQTYESATESEVDFAYNRLKKQYGEERFLPGEAGAEAARKLTELEEAYREAKQKFEFKRSEQDYGSLFGTIENLIKQNKTTEAQFKLDEITDRNAEWHYLQSIIFYKKSWYEESKYQLEMAVSMDSGNTKYKDALNRLNVFLSGQAGAANKNTQDANKQYRQADGQYQGNPNVNNQSGTNNYGYNQYNQNNPYENRNMGGCGSGGTENCCLQLVCADCCCECMGGDLISCC